MKIKEFIKENKTSIIVILILGLITYAIKLTTYSFSIDTEDMLNNSEQLLVSWISIGRYGLVFFKKILNLVLVNIYVTNIVAFLLLFMSTIVWIYNINKVTNKTNKIANIILGGIIMTSPIIVEQFNFTLQCVEISLALLLLSLSFTIINNLIIQKRKNVLLLILAIAFIVISFACYQSFIPLYILFATFSFLLIYKNSDIDWKKSINLLLKYVIILILAFVIYKAIDLLILKCLNMHSTDYLINQIYWGTEKSTTTILRIIKNIAGILLAKQSMQYNLGMLICCIAFFIYIIRKFKIKDWVFYIALLTFLITPFMLLILIGGYAMIRTQMPLTIATAMGAYFLYTNIDKKILKNALAVIMTIIIIYQMIISILLFYTDYNVFNKQVEILQSIDDEIKQKGLDISKPIIYTGKYSATGDGVILKGETMGATFLEWDNAGQVGSNSRIGGLLQNIGIYYNKATTQQIAEAISRAKQTDIPSYPDEGYLIETEEYIIVNLGF